MTAGGNPTPPPGAPTCHLCEQGTLALLRAYEELARVTSDHVPWSRGGTLGVCDRCGGVQKVLDDTWHEEVRSIYEGYRIYHQSGGIEQATFDQARGPALTRSSRLLSRLATEFPLAESGRLLDVGCGNGALLRAFSEVAPGWTSAGTEWDAKYRTEVESIPGVEALHTVPPNRVPGRFDLVTMVHVLEHVPSPQPFLAGIRDKLNSGGLLVVHLPDHRQNPYELAIADHATHFAPETAATLLQASGYEVVATSDSWVPRELTLVVRVADVATSPSATASPDATRRRVDALLHWLRSVASAARDASEAPGAFGLFGTSTAATWLSGELGPRVDFYVDEDANRVGKTHLDRPILAPSQVPPGSTVFVALPTSIAGSVAQRHASPQVRYVMPPDCPSLA